MRDPPSKPQLDPPDCSTNITIPTLDLITGIGGGLTTMLLGGVALEAEEDSGDDMLKVAGAVAVGSTLFLVSGVMGLNRAGRCEQAIVTWGDSPLAAPPLPVPLVEAVAAKDPRAAQLTREAHDAASRHRCGPARAVARSVEVFDAEYYERVFLANATISRCL